VATSTKKKKNFWDKLSTPKKGGLIIVLIVGVGLIFPPEFLNMGDPWTIQIINAIANPIVESVIADVAPEIGAEAIECIEDFGGTYNFATFECDM